MKTFSYSSDTNKGAFVDEIMQAAHNLQADCPLHPVDPTDLIRLCDTFSIAHIVKVYSMDGWADITNAQTIARLTAINQGNSVWQVTLESVPLPRNLPCVREVDERPAPGWIRYDVRDGLFYLREEFTPIIIR